MDKFVVAKDKIKRLSATYDQLRATIDTAQPLDIVREFEIRAADRDLRAACHEHNALTAEVTEVVVLVVVLAVAIHLNGKNNHFRFSLFSLYPRIN